MSYELSLMRMPTETDDAFAEISDADLEKALSGMEHLRFDGDLVELYVKEQPGVSIGGTWVPLMEWQNGSGIFPSRAVDVGNKKDPAWLAIVTMAKKLDASICGQDGEIYDETGEVVAEL